MWWNKIDLMTRCINMISKLYDLGFHFEIIICKLNVPNEKLWYDTAWYDMIWHYLGPNKPSQWRPVLRLLDAGFSTFLKVQAAGCLAIVLVGRGLGHRGDWLMWAGCLSDNQIVLRLTFFILRLTWFRPICFAAKVAPRPKEQRRWSAKEWLPAWEHHIM